MESRYGIGISNRYAFFLDSDDDGSNEDQVIRKAQVVAAVDPKKAAKSSTDSHSKVNGAPAAAKKDNQTASRNNKTNFREGRCTFLFSSQKRAS